MYDAILYVLIIGSCGGLGLIKANAISSRVSIIKELIAALNLLRNQISWTLDPLNEVLNKISGENSSVVGTFFGDISAEILTSSEKKGKNTFSEIWNEKVDSIFGQYPLENQDLQIIKELGVQLGGSDLMGQQAVLDITIKKLEVQLESADERNKTIGKLYRTLGFIIGIVIVILII